MQLIVITTEHLFPEEGKAINALFKAGLSGLHLRKPNASQQKLTTLLNEVDPAYYSRIVLHDQFGLLDLFPLKGIHLNRRNPIPPQSKRLISISRSCHSLAEVQEAADGCNYIFLSPVFDSISKIGYGAAFTNEELRQATSDGIINRKVYALGGITPNRMPLLHRYGFGGTVVLGNLWEDFEKSSDLTALLQRFQQLQISSQPMKGLLFITHQTDKYTWLESAEVALQGGCRCIQLRMKEATPEEVEAVAQKAKILCDHYGAELYIDDHVEVCKRVNATGVHLGKLDMPIPEARKLLGDGFIIGGTANTQEDIERLYREGADYIGLGPFRFTTTKKNLSPTLGLEGYKKIVASCRQKNIHLPIFAIGGITQSDIPNILSTGVTGIALSSTILQSENPIKETQQINEIIYNTHQA